MVALYFALGGMFRGPNPPIGVMGVKGSGDSPRLTELILEVKSFPKIQLTIWGSE